MVEIKVDLKRNSKEDIRKVIKFLQNYIEDESISDSPDISPGAFNLFNNQETPTLTPNIDDDNPDDDEDEPSDSDLEIKPIF